MLDDCPGKLAYVETLGDRIKARREELGLSQTELAHRVGVSNKAVSQWENDIVKNLKPRNLIRTADELDKTSIRWLVFGMGPIREHAQSCNPDIPDPVEEAAVEPKENAMTTVTFDPLKYVEHLKAGGIPEAQARAMSEALRAAQATMESPATKADVVAIKADIAELRVDLIKWLGKFL